MRGLAFLLILLGAPLAAQEPIAEAPKLSTPVELLLPVETDATRAMATRVRERVDAAKELRLAGKADEARAIVRAVLDEALVTPGRDVSDQLNRALDQLSREATQAFDEETVIRALEPCLAYRIAAQGADHLDVQGVRGNLANACWALNQIERGRGLLEQALEVYARTLSATDPRVLDAKSNYAIVLFKLSEVERAGALMSEVVEGLLKDHAADDPSIQWAFSNLANMLSRLGDTQGALTYLERVHATKSAVLPADSADLAIARTNLANALRENGDPAAARFLLQDVLAVQSRHYPAGHRTLKRTRLNLATALYALGDYEGARILYEAIVSELEAVAPDSDEDLNLARSNLAGTLERLGDKEGAHALDQHILEVRTEALGPDHPSTLLTLTAVASNHEVRGELETALELGQRAIDGRRARGEADTLPLLMAESDLARVLIRLGRTDEGIELERSVLERALQRLDEGHIHVLYGKLALAGYIEDRDPQGALTLLRGLAQSVTEQLRNAGQALSPREAEVYALKYGGFIDPVLARCKAAGDAAMCLELIEAARAAPLISARALRSLDQAAAADPSVSRLRDELRRKSARLASLAYEGSRAEYDAAAIERGTLEQKLGSREGLAWRGDRAMPHAVDLAKELDQHSAAVSYRCYSPPLDTNFEIGSAPPCFVAFVLRRDGAVARVELGPASAIERAIDAWRRALGAADAATANADEAQSAGEALRKLVLDPVLGATGEIRRLIVTLDDALFLAPLDALPRGAGVVGDELTIQLRPSFLHFTPPAALAHDLVAFGGIDFDQLASEPEADERAELVEHASPRPTLIAAATRMASPSTKFTPLAQTLPEVRELGELFETTARKPARALVFTGPQASKLALTNSSAHARYLHVATHGFFAADDALMLGLDAPAADFAARVRGLSPRALCGLAFAGANQPLDPVQRSVGTLTAEELAYLDLDGCELAVLSACDTSAGLRRVGIGIASLQSALHAAGARTTLTSLWRVSDQATRELMLAFYRALWSEGASKSDALWRAKRALRERRAPARDWAGWVLTDA